MINLNLSPSQGSEKRQIKGKIDWKQKQQCSKDSNSKGEETIEKVIAECVGGRKGKCDQVLLMLPDR